MSNKVTKDNNNLDMEKMYASCYLGQKMTNMIKFDVQKFDGSNNFDLWESEVKDFQFQKGYS